jgi:hypothetical protein
MEVPDITDRLSVDDGVGFTVDADTTVFILYLGGAPAGDDSIFPLTDVADITDVTFRGDGEAYRFLVQGNPDPEDLLSLDRMLGSISFEPWDVGEQRGDWVALEYPTDRESAWPLIGNNVVAVYAPDGDPRVIDFPDTCGEGQNMTVIDGIPVLECPDGSELRYDESGIADEGNPEDFQDNVRTFAAVRSHDGHVLVEVS